MATFTPDTNNEMFQLAIQLVNQSNRNIFLTGKAGTGKTTFLKYIRQNCAKQMAVVAPTGVAAINAGGVTIHSFFQLPLSPFIPEANGKGFQPASQETSNKHSLLSRLRFNNDKKKVFQQLELLVIDEISMVRADILDAIDTVLRYIRQRPNDRFGGVQLLFIGDMLQLPPVVKEDEWNILKDYYSGQYFFDSKVLEEEPPVYIEFNKIYRQSDQRFIDLLNQVRNNELDEDGYAILESRFQPSFRRSKKDGYIILTTHNNKAQEINANELSKLSSKVYSYDADVKNDFTERAFPADEILYLKEGAQVMFIRNDSAERGKRYFNGKIGVVSKLDGESIFVQCDDEEIEVQKETWENIRYTMNNNTRQLDSDVLGSFTQYPLRLAWAITIHKSQGLTFEKAVIDAGAAFAPGQVYVALSRCTNLEGMVLQSQVRSSSLFSDSRIMEFSQRSSSTTQLQQEVAIASKNYQLVVLQSTFDFATAINSGKEILEYLFEHSSSFNAEAVTWITDLLQKLEALQLTATKFQQQLQFLFQQEEKPETNQPLQERIGAAAIYFGKEIKTIEQFLQESPATTDSRQHSKEYNDGLKEVFAQLAYKRFMLEGIPAPFELEKFQLRKRAFVLPTFSINAYAGASQKKVDSPHPSLHYQLRKVRETLCERKNLPVYLVAGSSTIDEMARYLPQTLVELRKISGFGDVKIEQYGQQFLNVILEYSEQHQLSSLMHEKKPKRERLERAILKDGKPSAKKKKGETQEVSFQLFKQGKSIAEIAAERNLALTTIESHIARYVAWKEIDIDQLISKEKQATIAEALKDFDGSATGPIKHKLGEDYSFGEIQWMMAALGIKREKKEKVE